MTTLVVGATGATGKHLVAQLLKMDQNVKVIVRSTANIPDTWNHNDKVSVITADVSKLSVSEMATHLMDCQAAASCLGHNMSFKGIYGQPRKLVTDTMKLICTAIKTMAAVQPVRVVLMNTAGNRNRDLSEPISFGEKMVITLLRLLLPPHPDNEQAADYLRVKIGQNNPQIEWVAVRPDSLFDQDEVTPYEIHPSPTRSALFNPGKTSRINVGHLMARLITDDELWSKWKGQMPVIYNKQ